MSRLENSRAWSFLQMAAGATLAAGMISGSSAPAQSTDAEMPVVPIKRPGVVTVTATDLKVTNSMVHSSKAIALNASAADSSAIQVAIATNQTLHVIIGKTADGQDPTQCAVIEAVLVKQPAHGTAAFSILGAPQTGSLHVDAAKWAQAEKIGCVSVRGFSPD